MMSLLEVYQSFFRKAFDFSGRAARIEYWVIWGTNLLAVWLVYMLLSISSMRETVSLFLGIYMVVTFIPTVSLTVRRIRDTGRSVFWCLTAFLPWIGPLLIFWLCLKESERPSFPEH